MSFTFASVHTRMTVDDYLDRLEIAHPQYEYGIDGGREYGKIWKRPRGSSSRSIVAFVDTYGNLYRADSWKKRGRMLGPAKDQGVGVPSGDPRRHRKRGAPTFRQQAFVARKMRILTRENRTRRPKRSRAQMAAIAYSMAGVSNRRRRRRR